jgi:hypothetical protein
MKMILVTAAAAALFFSVHSAVAVDEESLEPCINGGVSATGQFASQAEEDLYLAERQAIDLDLEPCINGGVSASGAFASQVEEDLYSAQVAGGL